MANGIEIDLINEKKEWIVQKLTTASTRISEVEKNYQLLADSKCVFINEAINEVIAFWEKDKDNISSINIVRVLTLLNSYKDFVTKLSCLKETPKNVCDKLANIYLDYFLPVKLFIEKCFNNE